MTMIEFIVIAVMGGICILFAGLMWWLNKCGVLSESQIIYRGISRILQSRDN